MVEMIKSRKMSFSEVFSTSFEIFKKKFGIVALLALLFSVPYALYFQMSLFENFVSSPYIDTPMVVESAGVTLLFALVQLIMTLMVTFMVELLADGKTVELKNIFTSAIHRLIPVILTILFGVVVVVCLSILMVLFGINIGTASPFLMIIFFLGMVYLSIKYTFFIISSALRKFTGVKAYKYSGTLVKGNWWKVFGFYIGLGLIIFTLQFILLTFLKSEFGFLLFLPLGMLWTMFAQIFYTVIFLNLESFNAPTNPEFALNPEEGNEGSTVETTDTLSY